VYIFLNTLYHHIVYHPLKELYLKGPNLAGYGFWAGEEYHLICSKITNTPGLNTVFIENPGICEDIIEKRFYSFLLAIQWIIGMYCVYSVIWIYIHRVVFINPFLQSIKNLEQKFNN
jgi:hypothetical protein